MPYFRVAKVFGSVMVRAWNVSSGSDFGSDGSSGERVSWYFSIVSGRHGSGSGFGS